MRPLCLTVFCPSVLWSCQLAVKCVHSGNLQQESKTSIYDGHSINKLHNGVIPLTVKIWKIRNMLFEGYLIRNTSCEFYTMTSSWRHWWTLNTATLLTKASHTDQHPDTVLIFCGQKDLRQMTVTLSCVQCTIMVTSVSRDHQYMFGLRNFLVVEKVLLMSNDQAAIGIVFCTRHSATCSR